MGVVIVDVEIADAVAWQKDKDCSYNPVGNIDIWRIYIPQYPEINTQLKTLLSPDEQNRASRYYQEKDRQRFITGRAALRVVLGRYLHQPAKNIEFGIGTNKKPFVKSGSHNLNYNVSHSDEWVLIAVSTAAVGVDTEKIDHSFDYESILDDHFNAAEIGFIRQEKSADRFYLLWTRKESVTKLTAQGIDERIKNIPGLDGRHLTDGNILDSVKSIKLSSFKLDDHNYATLATENEVPATISFWDIDLTLI